MSSFVLARPAAAILCLALFQAKSAAQEPSGGPTSAPPPEVAEIHALFADGQVELGAAAFETACASGNSLVLDALWVELRGLTTADEIEAWDGADADAGSRCDVLREMVASRALAAGQSIGERLAVHYERLAKVREDYWLPSRRVQGGAADSLGRHPDLLFDDRGLIYLRMGEPDEVSYAIAGNAGSMGNRVEGWAYDRPGARRIFFFSPVTTLSVGNFDFRLLDAPWRAVGAQYASTQLQLVNAAEAGSNALTDLLLAFQGLNPYYTTLAYRARRGGPELLQDLTDERIRTMADVKFAVDSVPDAPDLEAKVRFAWERLRFLDPAKDRTVVWLLAGVRGGDLTAASTPEGQSIYRLTLAATVRSGASVARDSVHVDYRVPQELADEDAVIARIPVTVGAGEHPFTLTVEDTNTGDRGRPGESGDEPRKPAGNWARGVITGITLSELPEISDIAVAADSGGSWTRDGTVFLAVTPSHVTGPGGTAHLYFETYGVSAGAAYAVEIRVVPKDAADRMWQMAPGETAFRLSFESEMPPEAIGRHHLKLDLSDTRPGAYMLGVRVREEATGRESLPASTPIVRAE